MEKIVPIEIDDEDNSALRLKFPPAMRSGNYPVICDGVKKAYGSHIVFHDVTLTIIEVRRWLLSERMGKVSPLW